MAEEGENKSSDAANQNLVVVEAGSAPIIVSELRPNDVLLGKLNLNLAALAFRERVCTSVNPQVAYKERYLNDPIVSVSITGRGAPIIKYHGNVKFRAVIKSRKREYMATHRRVEKDVIALSIINVIAKRNGRFLQRISPRSNQATVGEPPTEGRPPPVWKIADRDVVNEKVKQALRDKDSAVDDQEETSPVPAAQPSGNFGAAQQQLPALHIPHQASLDPRVSHLGGYSPLLSSMYSFPHQGLSTESLRYPLIQPPRNPSLALLIQQVERERQLTAMLQSPFATTHHPEWLDPSVNPAGQLPLLGSSLTDPSIDQLLRERQLRHQLLQSSLRGGLSLSPPSHDTATLMTTTLGREGATGSDLNTGIALDTTFAAARGNLKRDEDEASSVTVKRGGKSETKDSSPDSETTANDPLKEYADLLSVGQTTSSSSPDHPRKKRKDSSSSTSDQQSHS